MTEEQAGTKKIDDGGAAFPSIKYPFDPTTQFEGMSLRDWFAGQALIGCLSARNGFLVDIGTDNVAPWAYRIADAMIAERKGGAS